MEVCQIYITRSSCRDGAEFAGSTPKTYIYIETIHIGGLVVLGIINIHARSI